MEPPPARERLTWQPFHRIEAQASVFDDDRSIHLSGGLLAFLDANFIDFTLQFRQINLFRNDFTREGRSQNGNNFFQFFRIAGYERDRSGHFFE